METQARVLATLNKLKEVKAQKQNLGAIEDAIRGEQEAFTNDAVQIKRYMDDMSLLAMELEDGFQRLASIGDTFLAKYNQIDDYYNAYDTLVEKQREFEEFGMSPVSPDWMMVRDMFEDEVGRYNDLEPLVRSIV
jgi:predicted alpha-1,6-mannanase (GH76 family)